MEQQAQTNRGAGLRAWLMYGGVPVGLIAAGFVAGSSVMLGLSPSLPLLGLAFCGTLLVYQVERAWRPAPEDVFNQPERLAWVQRHRSFVWLSSALAVIGAIFCLPFLRGTTLALGVGLGMVSLFYLAPLLPGQRRLKAVWFLKPLAIAGAWAVGGVLLPLVEAGQDVVLAAGLLALARLLFVLPNALLADWPDCAGDRQAGLRTVATELSWRWLRRLAAVSSGMAVGVEVVFLLVIEAPVLHYVDLLGPALMLALVLLPLRRTRFYFNFVLDLVIGWPAMTALFALLG